MGLQGRKTARPEFTANRLISAQNAGTDCNVSVLGGNKKFWGNTYDAWGNLLAKTVTKCSAEPLSVTADVTNVACEYCNKRKGTGAAPKNPEYPEQK